MGEIVWYVDYYVNNTEKTIGKENKIAQSYHPNAASLCTFCQCACTSTYDFYIVVTVLNPFNIV